VAAVGRLGSRRVRRIVACAGSLAPGERAVDPETPYDLASLTKSFVAMTALRLVQRGALDLHAPIAEAIEELSRTPGGESPLALLLSHRAGLAAWGALYREHAFPPGSVEARRAMLREAAVRVDASRGRQESVYSDLGYLLAGETLVRRTGVDLAALVEREVTRPLGIAERLAYAGALDGRAREALVTRAAPTESCTLRGRVVRGEVHDENCYVFGGVSGHAGLFGTAEAVLTFGIALLIAYEGRSRWLDQALLRWALAPRGPGYVVGFDTKSAEGSSAGALFSARAFGHLGFTGTSLWCDPMRRVCAVLLTNRVHPTRENIAIRAFRPRFHDLVAQLPLGGGA